VTYAVAEKVSIDFFCLRSDNADFAQAADIIKGVGTSSAEQVATPQAIDGFVDWLVHVLHL
jgi:hypothetical protein